jgi:hypothetical protein
MNHNHYSFGLTALLMFICQSLSAHDFEVDGIYYTYLSQSDKTVAVSSKYPEYFENSEDYSGNVVIPPTVTYQGMTYSVTSISGNAFRGCTELTSIEIPNSVTSIGSLAFSECTSLTNIEIPSSVTSISSDAFNYTGWYDNQPEGLVYVGKFAYKYKGFMPDNTSIVLKDGTVGIVDYTFSGRASLTNIEIPNSVTSIGYRAFAGCTGLTSIEIPNSVTSIGHYAFAGCSGLTSIVILNGVTSISYAAFFLCAGLKSIEIPSSVTSIDFGAFAGCTGVTSIYCNAVNPPACYEDSFHNDTKKNCTLYVPSGSVDAYKAANVWKDFVTIEENSNVTALESISVMDNQNAPLYNLQGAQVVAPRPDGLYIRNGKKVMMK